MMVSRKKRVSLRQADRKLDFMRSVLELRFLVCLILLCGGLTKFHGQQLVKGVSYAMESCFVGSGEDEVAPFWLTANRHGLSSIKNCNGYLRVGLFRDARQDSLRQWRHSYGLDIAVTCNHTSSFVVQQAYYDIEWKGMQLSVGSKERPSALKHPLLSSGGLTFGTNARPVPQIRFEVPEYVAISGTGGWLHVKGCLGYGLYTDNNWQKDFVALGRRYTLNGLHHVKAGYLKIGNEKKFPIYFEGALEMATQFGGTAYNVMWGRQEVVTEDIRMGHGFKDFLKALLPFGNGGDPTDGIGYSNVTGNHLGSWHASFAYQAKDWKIRAYYEHFFEDHSMIIDEFAWKDYTDNFGNNGFSSYIPPLIPGTYYWKDGLYGIEIAFPANPFVSGLVYEYVSTKEQSGPVYHDHTAQISDQISGIDNYYNHVIYTGWQHWGMSMGSPFLLSPIYNSDGVIQFKNNRVRTHHLGFCGNPTKELSYRVLLSHSKYWGTYNAPLIDTQEQTSSLLELTYTPLRWKGWLVKGAFAWDNGSAVGDNCGGMLTLRKTGILIR